MYFFQTNRKHKLTSTFAWLHTIFRGVCCSRCGEIHRNSHYARYWSQNYTKCSECNVHLSGKVKWIQISQYIFPFERLLPFLGVFFRNWSHLHSRSFTITSGKFFACTQTYTPQRMAIGLVCDVLIGWYVRYQGLVYIAYTNHECSTLPISNRVTRGLVLLAAALAILA